MRPELFKIPGLNFSVPSYGAMVVIAFLVGTWWMTRRAAKVKADPDIVLSLALISLIFGWLGGRTFYIIHHWKTQFAGQPLQMLNLTAGGFEIYGGLLMAAAVCVLYLRVKGLSIRLYSDLYAPTLLFGMGVGRIGCFLVGCCWGGTCPASLPWAVRFPASSMPFQQQWEDRLVTLPAEMILVLPQGSGMPIYSLQKDFLKLADLEQARKKLAKARTEAEKLAGNAAKYERAQLEIAFSESVIEHFDKFEVTPQELGHRLKGPEFRTRPVHPSQIYATIGPLLLAWLTNAYFFRRKRHGTVMAVAIMFYAMERFVEEGIRIDNPLDTFGLTVSQGISIGMLVFGILWYLILQKMPPRSSRPARVPQPIPPTDVAA